MWGGGPTKRLGSGMYNRPIFGGGDYVVKNYRVGRECNPLDRHAIDYLKSRLYGEITANEKLRVGDISPDDLGYRWMSQILKDRYLE